MNEEHRRVRTFETPTPPRLRIDLPRGKITVTAEDTAETSIELFAPNGDMASREWIYEAEITEANGEITVRGPNIGLTLMGVWGPVEANIRVPLDSHPTLGLGAGRVETQGKLGEVSVSTGAGSVRIEACAQARVKTGSGDIEVLASSGSVNAKTGAGRVTVGQVGGNVKVTTGAGNARLDSASGAARFTTGHGNVDVEQAGDAIEAFTASGNIRVGRADRGRVRARTISGGVSVGVASGVAALLDINTLSGRVDSALEAAEAPADGEGRVELVLSTVSGNVSVARA